MVTELRTRDNIKIDLKELESVNMGLNHQGPVARSFEHINVPSDSIKGTEFIDSIGFVRKRCLKWNLIYADP